MNQDVTLAGQTVAWRSIGAFIRGWVADDADTGSYEVIHLGGQAAVVVPVSDFLRLQALEQAASVQELEDAEDKAALADWCAREAAGHTSYVPHDEALRRLSLAGWAATLRPTGA